MTSHGITRCLHELKACEVGQAVGKGASERVSIQIPAGTRIEGNRGDEQQRELRSLAASTTTIIVARWVPGAYSMVDAKHHHMKQVIIAAAKSIVLKLKVVGFVI